MALKSFLGEGYKYKYIYIYLVYTKTDGFKELYRRRVYVYIRVSSA